MSNYNKIRLIVLFIFLLLMFISTPLILHFNTSVRKPYEINQVNLDNVSYAEAFFCIDEQDFFQNILKTAAFRGWAFKETDTNNDNKTIKLLFYSPNKSYIVDTDIHNRTDLTRAFRKKKLYGTNHGWVTEFTPLNMSNGIYHLFIMNKENENVNALIDTERYYEKTGNGLKALSFQEENIKGKVKINVQDNIKYRIDKMTQSNDIVIMGWCFIDGENMDNKDIVIGVKSQASYNEYKANVYARKDVAAKYKNMQYLKSGFYVIIPSSMNKNIQELNIKILNK